MIAQHSASPTGALFRSLLVPGWGQYYTEPNGWGPGGKIHFITDVATIGVVILEYHINTKSATSQQDSFCSTACRNRPI